MDYLVLIIIIGVIAYIFREKIAEALAGLFDGDDRNP